MATPKPAKLTQEQLDEQVIVEMTEDVELLEWRLWLRAGQQTKLVRSLLLDERLAGKFKEL